MTLEQEWRIAKWLSKHGKVVIADAPAWVRKDCRGPQRFYAVVTVHHDQNGYPVCSDEDILLLTDRHRDQIAEERERRDAIVRSKKSLWIALAALLLSLVSIAWQICTWILQTG